MRTIVIHGRVKWSALALLMERDSVLVRVRFDELASEKHIGRVKTPRANGHVHGPIG